MRLCSRNQCSHTHTLSKLHALTVESPCSPCTTSIPFLSFRVVTEEPERKLTMTKLTGPSVIRVLLYVIQLCSSPKFKEINAHCEQNVTYRQ